MELVEDIYKLSSCFPDEEKFGLTNQIRRSSVSIASNIAEGAGRNSKKEFRNFLGIANGSLNETTTQLELSIRLGYVDENMTKVAFIKSNEIQKMHYGLLKKLSNV
jgi:four helix bundle protein